MRVPEKRPLWFVFSGMGSQWGGMAKALMAIPTFRDTISRLQTYLQPYGVDLKDVILNEDDKVSIVDVIEVLYKIINQYFLFFKMTIGAR